MGIDGLTFDSLEEEVRFLRGLVSVQRLADEVLEDCIERQLGLNAAADVFLRINGWRLEGPPKRLYAQMMKMLESGTLDIAHLEPWLRGLAKPAE